MSFILDALRRAEADPAPAPGATAPIVVDRVEDGPADPWRAGRLIAGGTALVALGAALAWWLGAAREPVASTPATPPPVAPAQAASPPPSPPGVTAPSRRPGGVRALDTEAARARPPAPPRNAAPDTPAAGGPAALPPPGTKGTVTILPDPAAQPATVSETPVAGADPGDALPGYENLLTAGRIDLPNLNMDMHVYNRVPAKRFVFVNLRKYREGDRLDARTRVEEITPRGAVLNHDGLRFFLRPN